MTLLNDHAESSVFKHFEPYQEDLKEEYMSSRQLEHFRNILSHWHNELIVDAARTVDYLKEGGSNFSDPADRASKEEEFSIELRTRDRERKLIKKVEETIDSIDKKEYGYCVSCGIEIGIRRLEARPTANQCVDCKSVEEFKERHVGSS